MSSGGIRISQQNYYSTHNALFASLDDQSVRFVLHEMDGSRHGALRIYPFYDIQMIKRLLIKKLSLPASTRVKDLRILYKGQELPNYRTMDCYINNFNTEDKLYWCLKESPTGSGIRPLGMKMSTRMENIFNEVALSMKNNYKPRLTMDGTGGTYEMFNKAGKCIAIFKPCDEEAFTPYNPRGYVGNMNQQGFRPGVLSGEGATREVAAYILDVSYDNFSGVPATTMVEIAHQALNNRQSGYNNSMNGLNLLNTMNHDIFTFNPSMSLDSNANSYSNFNVKNKLKWKVGSLQEFVVSRGTSGNYNPNMFSVEDVHKIGILDIRVLNLDRNDGNILVVNNPAYFTSLVNGNTTNTDNTNGNVANNYDEEKTSRCNKENKYKLIPIDHGLILPDVIDICDLDWVWYEWPQSKEPFSEEELAKIFSFNVDKDIERLKKYLHVRDECLRTMKVTTKFLQIAASMKLNLHQIATMIVRHDMDIPSELELIIKKSIEQAYKVTDSTSIISTNRLGNAIDLIENAVIPIINHTHSDCENLTDTEYGNNHNDENENRDIDLSELPSSTFFHYPDHFEARNNRNETDHENIGTNREKYGNEEKTRDERRYRTTVRRRKHNSVSKSTWSLVDSKGHPVQIEWDVMFQNLFFKILEEMFVGNLNRLHPNWQSYPYHGKENYLYNVNHKNQKTLPFTTLWFND
ncbi:hypothetical protein MACK_002886 [Theileria orientalis]|uniref:PI3K/PI4K catalytic domain-containing protein n=1 Tax=Theileria orientalis TaxID=68886 RepID=A0A976QW29_THEOR|nr:hypothetical protein MACK_002886 [Theileria orientalis]